MAGFWAARGVFNLRTDDARVGGFLALAAGIVGAAVSFLVIQATVGIPQLGADATPDDQNRFVLTGIVIIVIAIAVAWVSRRTVFSFRADDPRIRTYLTGATAVFAFALVFALARLLFGPTGWFSTINGSDTTFLGGLNLSSLALTDPLGLIVEAGVALLVAAGAVAWARRGDNARFFPVWIGGLTTGLVAAAISAPIAAGVFGGVTGGGTDALIALFRTLGLGVFQSAFAQGLTSDPLDKTISYTVVFLILGALPLTVRSMFSRGEATIAD